MYGRGHQQQQQQHSVVVLDNGAGSIKLGFEGELNPRLVFPNCTAKAKGERQLYVGDALLEARELGGMLVRRPHDRGFLVNADLERDIWAKGFASLAATLAGGGGGAGGSGRSKPSLDCQNYSLLLTEPLFNFDAVRAVTEEIVFEEFGFRSLLAAPAPWFSLHYACSQPVLLPPPGLDPTSAAAALYTQQLAAQQQQQLGLPTASGRPLTPAAVAAGNAAKAAGAGLIVDAGFSSCYVAPFYDGQLLSSGIRRLNLGGKALTNLLKETVSYRSLNMTDEGLLMERLKEQLCWVSQDATADLRQANPPSRSPHRRDVVLPDGVHNLRGYVRPPAPDVAEGLKPGGKWAEVVLGPWPDKPQHLQEMEAAAAAGAKKPGGGGADEAAAAAAGGSKGGGGSKAGGVAVVDQVLSLNNELFMVPEALFRPSDIGLAQAGLPEVVTQAVAACPAGLAPLLYGQVLLTGGCCNLPGFAARFESELRHLVPDELELLVLAPQEPELAAWRGASVFAAGDNYWQCVRSRKQYNESGPSAPSRRETDRGRGSRGRGRGGGDDDDDDDDDSDSF